MRPERLRSRPVRLAAVMAVASMALAACGQGSADKEGDAGEPRAGGVATIDWVANPTSLDPLKYNVLGTYNLVGLVYNTLYRWTEEGGLDPELATEDPEVSEDGLTVTFPIREGVNFHDGSPLTAEDVAFTIEQVINPENGSIWYAGLSPITKVSVTDDTTVEVTLSRPHAVLQGIISQVPIISADTEYKPVDTYAREMNGTGPFKFVSWDQGVEVELERNDDYWVEDRPLLDGVVMRTVPEDASRMANLSSGNADIMPMVPFNQVDALEKRGANVEVTDKSALLPLLFPSMQEGRPTANADFRKAVAWAIDRSQIIDNVFKDRAESASTVMSQGTPHWNEDLGTTYGDDPDLDEAKAALAKSGVKAGTKINLIVRNEPMPIAMGTIIQQNLRALGLEASLSPEESAAYLPKLFAGDFDLMMLNIEVGLTSGFTPTYVYSALHSESGGNFTGFSDEKLDELLVKAIGESKDPDAAWAAVQERELETVPLIPTVRAPYVEGYSSRLQGHTPSSLFSLRDLDQAWLSD
ncbi:ABC transporter substrate-binding protein [Nocardioides gilvus]|uniref:ABC transporter substrate-binding protein n=1 Tax=Nocardioides gilvus TaxID=1735589 RepID=UPI000D7467F9|nr:ABC transporter substrate-binding protein [Nocardioides gilvus]